MAPELHAPVAAIFDQAQVSIANHHKNCVALYKFHLKAKDGAFIDTFLDMLSRVVVVKKGPPTVDRILKFTAQYVRFVNEKQDDAIASVFVASILEWVIQGFVAKNKIVRYQTVHLVVEMISFLGEVDEDIYLTLRESLIERSTCDKESTIRAQAVSALARLIASDDEQDGEKSILEVLLEVMTLDPAPEVRRAALLHAPLIPATLPAILSRTRDVDPLTRKVVFASVLTPHLDPRHLTIAQREKLVRAGLGDREPAVRLACGKMLAGWLELVSTDTDADPADALIAFLTLFDVVGPGEAIASDALLSLQNVFDGLVFSDAYWRDLTPESAVLARAFVEHSLGEEREDRLESAGLPVVTAFAFHVQEAYNALLQAIEGAEVATRAAEERGAEEEEAEADEAEEELAKREVVQSELLRMAVKLDYGDEIGRRKIYAVMRDMLAHPQLPPGLIERCLDVLKEIMPSERELVRVVVEIIMDLREGDAEPEPEMDHDMTQSTIRTQSTLRRERSLRRAKERDEMTPEEALQADLTDMRCLALVVGMLERVHGNLEENSTLEGILADLIIPAVRRKELGIREKGLVALGLCCLIAKVLLLPCYVVVTDATPPQSIAIKSLQLFLSQIQTAPAQLKVKLLQIVFDLMVVYGQGEQLWGRVEDGQAILAFLADTLEAEETPAVQAVLCEGLAKLLLAGLADDPKGAFVLKTLLLAYVSPFTAGNAELRQCLAYFFGMYCYASADNQSRVRQVFMPAFDEVTRMHDELGEDQTMVTPQQFGLLVVDWTDARKAAETAAKSARRVHADLAVDILVALYDSDRRSEDQEVLCTLFSHLHLEGPLEPPLLVKLSVLLQHIQTQCPFDDPTLDKAVGRFKSRFNTEFEADLAEVDWAEWGTEEMREVYDYIGIDVPDYDGRNRAGTPTPESPVPKTRKGKAPAKRSRSKSAPAPMENSGEGSGGSDEDEDEEGAPPPSPTPAKKTSLKHSQLRMERAHSASEESEQGSGEEKEEARLPSPPAKPKAKAPARRSRSKPVPEVPEEPDPAEEDEVRPASPPPKAKGKGKAPARRSRSKPAPEEPEERGSDEEALPSKASKVKAAAKTKRSRSKTTRRESDPGSADESSILVPTAVPPRKSTRQARAKTPPPPQDVDSDAENEAPPTAAGPVTPPKNTNGRKRVRTPGANVSLPSPADKKRRKPAAAAAPVPTRGTRSSSRRAAEPPREVALTSDDDFGGYSEC
ncbi:hypothetical protein MVEN_00431000 [Mycena venus]|uniref:Nuclear condensin complex subunit 3 C-terminal domain-containing protein n=1 Tax=Mycena venus TaxID=2733690 RepID=A0A8H7DBG6_9AGAR|nr:hypothetical protein MVEN_00431000 [Mycena venus]